MPTHWLSIPALLALWGFPACADDAPARAKPWFIQAGAGRIDTGAEIAALVQVGIPVYRRGVEYAGIFGGGTRWRRGAFANSQVQPGSLLEKTAYWAGAYAGGRFCTFGAGGEWTRKGTYVTPRQTNAWFDESLTTTFGATAFLSMHERNGFGVFLRGGTASGVGAGLSLNF